LRTKYAYIDTHLRESLVEENSFVLMPPEDIPPPSRSRTLGTPCPNPPGVWAYAVDFRSRNH